MVVANFLDELQQVIHLSAVEPLILHDVLALEVELPGDGLGRCQRPFRRARNNRVDGDPGIGQALAHLRRVVLALVRQRARAVGQLDVVPARLAVAHEVEHFHSWHLSGTVASPSG
ncbi:hypothetical protein D3C78_1185320 [compost metagenome]